MRLSGLFGKSNDRKAIEAYNLALEAKYEGNWPESLRLNQLANELRPGDEATLWNLAIAATALNKWNEARFAWRSLGIEVDSGSGEVFTPEQRACVRANPHGAADVVWGTRIDPARIRVENVPLPTSKRRYRDILINDGAQEGTRISNGEEYPVFDELGIWRVSRHSTFQVQLTMPSTTAMDSLETICRENDVWVEDWSTVRILCNACSRGNPGEHVCTSKPPLEGRFGFAAKSDQALRQLLTCWVGVEEGARVEAIELVVPGVSA